MHSGRELSKNNRQGGIELLKILAMIMIVFSHVSQSAGEYPTYLPDLPNKLIDLSCATDNISILFVDFVRYLGPIGNDIFFICSFWFLCDNRQMKKRKVLSVLLQTWSISCCMLLVYELCGKFVPSFLKLRCLLPITFNNNWFVTCYLIIYLIHPYLNLVIDSLSQRNLFILCSAFAVMYCCICFIIEEAFFNSVLIVFIGIYFLVSYVKRYGNSWTDSIKWNIGVLIVSSFSVIAMFLFTNYMSLSWNILNNDLLKWSVNNNPFILLIAFSLFNIFKKMSITCRWVNYVSSLSLTVYLFHENILVRSFSRIEIWRWILDSFGYDRIVAETVIYSITLFISAVCVSIVWNVSAGSAINLFIERKKFLKSEKISDK